MARETMESTRLDLWRRFKQSGCGRSRSELILLHQKLVKFIASKFKNRGALLEDLEQVGNIGLINAVDRYDPDRGTKFSTYATSLIRGEIQRYFRDKHKSMRIPRGLQELHFVCRKVEEDLHCERNRKPTALEIAERIGISEEEALEALNVSKFLDLISFEQKIGNGDDDQTMTIAEVVGKEDNLIENIVEYEDLQSAIKQLDSQKQFVINHCFFMEESQTIVAKKLNISQMHVSRLQKKAIGYLRSYFGASVKQFDKILIDTKRTKTSPSVVTAETRVSEPQEKYDSPKKKERKMVQERKPEVVTIPMGMAALAFWLNVAIPGDEPASISQKYLSELIALPFKQIFANMTWAQEKGFITRVGGKSTFIRRIGKVQISHLSRIQTVEAGGVTFEKGCNYDLVDLAKQFRSDPKNSEIIKQLTKSATERPIKTAAELTSITSKQHPTIESGTPSTSGMFQQLVGAIRFLGKATDFDQRLFTSMLEPEDMALLRSWIIPKEPLSSAGTLKEEPVKGNEDVSTQKQNEDVTLDRCLNTINTLFEVSSKAIVSLYQVAKAQQH